MLDYRVVIYQDPHGRQPLVEWVNSLRDRRAQAAIDQRLRRLSLGNLGDFKTVGKGVFELRIDTGPGYRV